MKCCYKPRDYFDLSQKQREIIAEYVENLSNSYIEDVQVLTIKMASIILGQMGCESDFILQFIAMFRQQNRIINRCHGLEEQIESINSRLKPYIDEDIDEVFSRIREIKVEEI